MGLSFLAHPGSTAPRAAWKLAVWVLAAPFALHLLCALMFGMEADTSVEVLLAVMFSAAAVGAAHGKLGLDPFLAAAAAAWPAALFAWRRWYWALDMHSPGGAAQGLVAWALGWKDPPAPLALAVVAAASAFPGWLLMRADRWHERRTGRSFFDDD